MQPQSDDDSVNDEGSLYNASNQEQLDEMRWGSASPSQISDSWVSIDPPRRSDENFHEGHETHEETSQESAKTFRSNVQISDIDDPNRTMSEGSEAPSRSRRRGTSGIDTLHHPEPLDRTTLSPSPKRRRLLVNRPVSSGNKAALLAAQLDTHVRLEKEKYHNLGLPCPGQCFNSTMAQIRNSWGSNDEHEIELQTFYFAIASSESLAILRDIIQAYRRSLADKNSMAGCDLSQAERLMEIEKLNENIAYSFLLRRCHIRQLFVNSSGSSQKTSDGFVNHTVQSLSTRRSQKTGNPNHIEDAEGSKAIMKEVYPGLQQDSTEYIKKYRTVSNLRKLGQRLHLLADKFGDGIIGLLPLATDVSAIGPALSITDYLYVISSPLMPIILT